MKDDKAEEEKVGKEKGTWKYIDVYDGEEDEMGQERDRKME